LLAENKINRYLLYAFGEIVLVVIGILIALQVNTWSENQKSHAKKEALLRALSVEFNANLKQLDSVNYFNARVVQATRKFFVLTLEQAKQVSDDSLRIWLSETIYLWTFDPQNGALRSGIASGDVHLIQNDTLVNLLFSWQDVVADAAENEERHINSWLDNANRIMAPHVRKVDYETWFYDSSKSKFSSDYRALVGDPLFEDFLAERFGQILDAMQELNLVRSQNVRILELIARELKATQ
ncbi:DUF6090 family protein, partial [Robiginitalea marina]|uniref:DUF6090 family protein n=1 Tax=Robiginitalea marina TaxID=2954105 RepID=UPI0035134898